MKGFNEWLESYEPTDQTDRLEFDPEIIAPGTLSFKVYDGEKVIVDGLALGMWSRKKPGESLFWIKAPAIGLSDFTPIDNIDTPIGNFIKDYVLMMWDFTIGRFGRID